MDVEKELISKCVKESAIDKLITGGVEVNHFIETDNQEIWEFLKSYIRKYKSQPSFDTVKESFPEYKWLSSSEPLEFIRDQFLIQVYRREGIGAFRDIATVFDKNDPDDMARISEIFLDKARDLSQIIPSSNISKFSSMPSRIELYHQRKKEGIAIGMPYGIERLDNITFGLHPHQYVTIAGWTGVGKSWLGLLLALNHYLEGYNPMIISLEMDEEEVYGRLDAIAVGLKQSLIRSGNLSGHDVKRWEEYSEKLDSYKNDIIVVDVDFATVDKVYAETSRWEPDCVIIDYIQLMVAPSYFRTSWERIGYISQMLKAQARATKIPIYGLAQSNVDSADEGAKLTNLAGSKDIGKHSDLVLGLYQNEDMEAMNKMEIRVEKNRNGPKDIIPMYWEPATADFREWVYTDSYEKSETSV